MRQIMTTWDGKCSKQGSILRVYARCIQVEKCSKVGTFAILCDLFANALAQKVSESPRKVQKMSQIKTAQFWKCLKQGVYQGCMPGVFR